MEDGSLLLRRVLVSACCLGLAAAGPVAPSPAAGQAGATKTVRVAIKGFENNITPFTVGFGALPATNDIQHLVYDALFWSQAVPDPEPWLAESAESADGGKTWDVKLRDDVTWHDGTPFTSADVAFSFDYYKAQPGASGRYAHHVSDVPAYDRSEIVDDHRLRMLFKQPAPQFRIMPGGDLPIIAKHIYENVDQPAAMTTQLPVGTGPFKLVEIVPDQRYRMEANKDHFKGAPKIDQLELVIVKDPQSAYTALRTGDIDMVERNIPPELVDQLRGTDGIGVAKSTRFDSVQMYFNARKAPWSDPKLRKAISTGIDLDALVDTVLLGHGRPGRDGFIHPDSPWALPEAEAGHDFDRAAAARMLDDAGYTAKDPDGIRKAPDGARLELNVLVSSFEPTDIRAMQLVAEQIAPLGVKLNVEPLDPATLRTRRQAPPGGIPNYDAYVSSLEAHAHVDPDGLYYFFHSPGPKGFGAAISGYTSAEMDRLIEEATGKENDERKEILGEAQKVLARDMPVIVLYYPDGQFAFRETAYDGWVADKGQGIFTKRSFLPGYEEIAVQNAADPEAPAVAGDDDDGGGVPAIPIAVAVVAAIGLFAYLGSRGRRRTAEDE